MTGGRVPLASGGGVLPTSGFPGSARWHADRQRPGNGRVASGGMGPINRKYAEAPEPDPAAFLARYGHHLRQVAMLHQPLTGGYLRKQLRFMHPTALGLDGWSLGHLRSLPLCLLDWLAEPLTLVEVTGRWREVLARGYTALIPRKFYSHFNTVCLLCLSCCLLLVLGSCCLFLMRKMFYCGNTTNPG